MYISSLIRKDLNDEYGILKLQNIILNIMQYIDELCLKNNIPYYIVGGTAIGTKRHQGFIPWDDDLDIAMTRENYNRFITVCRTQLDKEYFYFQEGGKDWPLYFSKVRLKNTYFDEVEADSNIAFENRGIFVDIFPLDFVSNHKVIQLWQYFCGKSLVAYSLSCRGYDSAKNHKKILMFFAMFLKVSILRKFFINQVQKYKNKETNFIGSFFGNSRFRNAIDSFKILGEPKRVPFEKISLLAPAYMHEYLTLHFGDYMQLPQENQRIGHHLLHVDFGKY
ncbi:MAG: LicD family protein [Bacteroidales bacterium]|nr:LicD family protein [Bacteroidales bacterium]